jgi:putative oxygen-independent coproporphyrinogen III oxidase
MSEKIISTAPPNSPIGARFGGILSANKSLLSALPPLSIYIHIPWCVRKCPYCDFNSHESKSAIPEAQYIDCLISDLDHTLPKIWGRRVYSIFFGGGTPSLFSAAGIDAILAAVRARVTVDSEAEITLEANPGTFEAEKFLGFRDAGVNRLSIGIQSFNANHLSALGRIHNDDEARRAIEIAQRTFDNINLDLMFALPKQTLAECETDIDTAVSFNTNHLSIYHLTLEPNTLFHRFPPPLPDDELAADMQDMIEAKLGHAGYTRYETSAYAKPSKESRHNTNYWQFGDYIGLGAGAHGKISYPDRITREARFKQPKAYMEQAPVGTSNQEETTVTANELPFEFMLNGLRLTSGFPNALFEERTGLPISTLSHTLSKAINLGLIENDPFRIAPTAKGRLYLNDLLEMFLPAPQKTPQKR